MLAEDTLIKSDSTKACSVIQQANCLIIEQLKVGLNALSNEQYVTQSCDETSCIGAHVRHIIEFYQECIHAIIDPTQEGLCYDNRERNMLYENSREAAITELETIHHTLSVKAFDNQPIAFSAITLPELPLVYTHTNVEREMMYLLDHTNHHMALIKLIAAKQGIAFDKAFGVAGSTLVHQKQTA